eukprot:TRINITY_DN7881_c0_g2_i1.p1 TRINITY_DN7881_c0_g2~~TRINITY_DN7881_c0_g2_i1.p1  ORF type:complete len:454 (+),score=76.49 TRINITY_DN7881_c0_g2_i1:89-1363(+)
MSEQQPLLGNITQAVNRHRRQKKSTDATTGYGSVDVRRDVRKDSGSGGRISSRVEKPRPFRRKKQLVGIEDENSATTGTVRAVSTCHEFQLKNIVDHYRSKGIQVREKEDLIWMTIKVPTYRFDSQPGTTDEPDILEAQRSTEDMEREYIVLDTDQEDDEDCNPTRIIQSGCEYTYTIFFYSYGVIVWWSLFPPSVDLETAGLPLLREVARMRGTFETGSFDKVELDTCRWTVIPSEEIPHEAPSRKRNPTMKENKSYIDNDCFYLTEADPELMLAYGCGLAQSAKISEFEDRIEEIVEETREYPVSMAKTGSSELTRTEVSKIRGALFIRKMEINLHTDILETPDVFWTRTDLEPLYLQARRYMEITHRTEVLNKRLEIVHELFEVFHEELNITHSNYLEWIIIWLILVELILGTISALLALR